MRRLGLSVVALLFALVIGGAANATDSLRYDKVPHVLRPGRAVEIVVYAPEDGTASVLLLDAEETVVYTIFRDYPMQQGANALTWDGTRPDHSVMPTGEYTLRVTMDGVGEVDNPLRVGMPYPMLTDILPDAPSVGDAPVTIQYNSSEAGTLVVSLTASRTNTTVLLEEMEIDAGANTYSWDGTVDGERVQAGDYALVLLLRNVSDTESMPQHVLLNVPAQAKAGMDATDGTEEAAVFVDVTPSPAPDPTPTPEPTAEPTPEPPRITPPYSSVDDGTYWAMHPGETDEQVVWDILTQPIIVYDDGSIKATEHVYLMSNPDGSGDKVAQIHGKSQGLHVIGETNEHGYVLVEAFSNYDPEYQPRTDEERDHAFDLKQGYIRASGLKTVEVHQDIAFVIDKLTQRMYMYIDGKPVTEFLIATGLIADDKYYNETIAGEYITISHTGGFTSGNMYCDMAIRINGGILLHEVPCKLNADGTKNFSSFEGYLGTKQSHGCVRIQRLKTPEGYNHSWLWNNLDRKGGYKVIIWDDMNERLDSPTVWQENPS